MSELRNGGGGTNSRLILRIPVSGTYRVVVTTFGPNQAGHFVLTIRR